LKIDYQNMLCIPKEIRSQINIINADQLWLDY
jgi:hypothetical protein